MNIIDYVTPNGICVLSLKGDINFDTIDDFKSRLDNFVNTSIKKYIINFQNLSSIDSDGIIAIASIFKKAKKFNGNMVLINLSPALLELFDVTRLTKIFDVYGSEDEAMKAMTNER